MIKFHKCSLCGRVTDNLYASIQHAMTHAYCTRSYSETNESKGFYVCPVCNRCHDSDVDMESCINSHILILRQLGYINPGDTLQ